MRTRTFVLSILCLIPLAAQAANYVWLEGEDTASNALHPFDLLRTHPPTKEREDLVRNQPDYPATPALDEASWQDLKSVCASTLEAVKSAPSE